MIWLLVTIAGLVGLIIGATGGYVLGIRALPRIIAEMPPSELDALADRVRELQDGSA